MLTVLYYKCHVWYTTNNHIIMLTVLCHVCYTTKFFSLYSCCIGLCTDNICEFEITTINRLSALMEKN